MVHKKYIKKGGKSFGPYYYENYRENGKIKTRYLGIRLPKEKKKNLWVNHKKVFSFFFGLFIISTFAYYFTKSELSQNIVLESNFSNPSLSFLKNLIGFSISDISDVKGTSNTILVLESSGNKTKEEEKNKTKEEEKNKTTEETLKNETKTTEETLKNETKTTEETLKNETKTTEGERKAIESSRKLEEKAKKNETKELNETITNITEAFSETLIQLDAVIFQPVKWARKISLEKKGKFKVNLPKQAKNIFVYSLEDETNRKEIARKRIEQKIVSEKVPKKKKDMNIFERIF